MVDRVLVVVLLLLLAKVVSWSRWHPVSGPPDKLGIPVPRKLQTFSLFFLTKPFRWAPFTCFLKGFSFPREIVFNFFLPENLFPFSSRALVCDSQHWERQQGKSPVQENQLKTITKSLHWVCRISSFFLTEINIANFAMSQRTWSSITLTSPPI